MHVCGALSLVWLASVSCSDTKGYKRLGPVQKGKEDRNEYRVIKLDNGIRAALVSNPTLDKVLPVLALNAVVGGSCNERQRWCILGPR